MEVPCFIISIGGQVSEAEIAYSHSWCCIWCDDYHIANHPQFYVCTHLFIVVVYIATIPRRYVSPNVFLCLGHCQGTLSNHWQARKSVMVERVRTHDCLIEIRCWDPPGRLCALYVPIHHTIHHYVYCLFSKANHTNAATQKTQHRLQNSQSSLHQWQAKAITSLRSCQRNPRAPLSPSLLRAEMSMNPAPQLGCIPKRPSGGCCLSELVPHTSNYGKGRGLCFTPPLSSWQLILYEFKKRWN